MFNESIVASSRATRNQAAEFQAYVTDMIPTAFRSILRMFCRAQTALRIMHRVYASIVSRQTSFTHCLRSTVNAGTMGNIFPTTASNGYIAPGHTEISTPNAVRWRPHHFDSRCEKLFCDGFCHENKKFYTGSSAHPNRTSEWVWSRGELGATKNKGPDYVEAEKKMKHTLDASS
ncbi:hypothetical protein Naga_100265g7 [Nannochloropsis gaditana]|uniref:Uncharacterized protein n=1 Tax=Nannochloropsis gaditana TaxID=72520 RepID=W7TWY6_9STRA|nr:hypothetical protein Naga_100265g7 [Nannochloropsis gaditana]